MTRSFSEIWVDTLRPRQNFSDFADDTFKCILLNGNIWMSIKFSFKFVPKGLIDNVAALFQIMALRRPATSHYLNQWCLVYWHIFESLSVNELKISLEGIFHPAAAFRVLTRLPTVTRAEIHSGWESPSHKEIGLFIGIHLIDITLERELEDLIVITYMLFWNYKSHVDMCVITMKTSSVFGWRMFV